jgi:hypothetical protein
MVYLRELVSEQGSSEQELIARTGLRRVDDVRDSDQASAAIIALKQLHEERRPPGAKQRRVIEDLIKHSDLSAAEAAHIVGAASLDELTGGTDGTASALIDRLHERRRSRPARPRARPGGPVGGVVRHAVRTGDHRFVVSRLKSVRPGIIVRSPAGYEAEKAFQARVMDKAVRCYAEPR